MSGSLNYYLFLKACTFIFFNFALGPTAGAGIGTPDPDVEPDPAGSIQACVPVQVDGHALEAWTLLTRHWER